MILPFPGGIARSGSKVGSKYKALRASTNTAFAPSLRGLAPSDLPADVRCVYEIVIDGLSLEAVKTATAASVSARQPNRRKGWSRSPPAIMEVSWGRSIFGCTKCGTVKPIRLKSEQKTGFGKEYECQRRIHAATDIGVLGVSNRPASIARILSYCDRSHSDCYEKGASAMECIVGALFLLFLALILFLAFGPFFTVQQQSAAIVQRFGKFMRVAFPGLNFKLPFIENVTGRSTSVCSSLTFGSRPRPRTMCSSLSSSQCNSPS